jgi:hypothetical protein
MLHAALKRRSSTVLRAGRVAIRIKSKVNVKGNGQECSLYTGVASLREQPRAAVPT